MMDKTAPADSLLPAPAWRLSPGLTDYAAAEAEMAARQMAIAAGETEELIWLLEHPPTYTAGTSARAEELIHAQFPVHKIGRGGKYTYHGPGQRVGYVLLDLNRRCRDLKCFVHALEGWVIDALAQFDVAARRAEGRIGIWCDDREGREAKIGAIGVRVRKWVSAHGFAVNIHPDLSHFGGIVPCGLPEFPVTSLAALGKNATMADFDAALAATRDDFLSALARAGSTCETD